MIVVRLLFCRACWLLRSTNFNATMKHPKCKLILLLPLMLLSVTTVAQERAPAALDSLPSVKKIDQVAISSDGAQVAYIVEGELWVATVADRTPHQIAASPKMPVRDVAWSTDSRHITWLVDLPGEKPASQLW